MSCLPKVAVAGIGGFAASHHAALYELESERRLRVDATCDPRERDLGEWKERFNFSGRGISVFDDFAAMLEAASYDWISLATPITLHSPMHAAAVNRGLSCYLEKPPTLDPAELERMIVTDSRARRQTQVGFAYVYEPERLRLKERMLGGEFGTLMRVCVRGSSRRTLSYYRRNDWAGRLKVDDTLVLDSCLGNAMAHHIHNVLFFAGFGQIDSWGACHRVEARLFRANPIDGADTVFLRGELEGAIEIRIALTHACETPLVMEESLICQKASIYLGSQQQIRIRYVDGSQEVIPITNRNYLKENLRIFGEYVSGAPHQLLGTLIHCRPFVQLNALAYMSTGQIYPVPQPVSEFISNENYWKIHGIETLLESFVETGDFSPLHLLGAPPATPDIALISDLDGLKRCIAHL